MNLLAMDTSTHCASVALKLDGKWFIREELELKRHAEWILPAIQSIMDEAKVTLSSLDGLVFGQGPGSFTGLRVACSVAKGLALGSALPLYPVSGLASIAFQVQEEQVLAMLDARMQAWYWGGFKGQQCLTEEHVNKPSEIHWKMDGSFVLAGVGFQALLSALPPNISAQLVACHEIYPTAQSMIELVEVSGERPVSAKEAKPKYIRQQVT
jgi:tRNA threonylcarbamoyladenosine biosynthesis protein TsaB